MGTFSCERCDLWRDGRSSESGRGELGNDWESRGFSML